MGKCLFSVLACRVSLSSERHYSTSLMMDSGTRSLVNLYFIYRKIYIGKYMWEVLVGTYLFEFLPLNMSSTLFRTIHLCERWHFCVSYQHSIPGLS